jgi:RHS repeat-associated protein
LAVPYYTPKSHLFSVAATTNRFGNVVERYTYTAYGKQTVTNSVGAILAKSAVGQDRGFTGYKLDKETGLYFARARMYSAKSGRFISRDAATNKIFRGIYTPVAQMGYLDGMGLYGAYFSPNELDPRGLAKDPECVKKCHKEFDQPIQDARDNVTKVGGKLRDAQKILSKAKSAVAARASSGKGKLTADAIGGTGTASGILATGNVGTASVAGLTGMGLMANDANDIVNDLSTLAHDVKRLLDVLSGFSSHWLNKQAHGRRWGKGVFRQ